MAPLSGLQSRSLAPFWNRFGALVFGYGERFYNFRGLRLYKEKFDPHWKPLYLAAPRGLALPLILTNISALIAGGSEGGDHKMKAYRCDYFFVLNSCFMVTLTWLGNKQSF
ncbi:MAG: phosphatidylglycerol lysyltransferase domain-containing protein [Gammaproteobacteria bacterium]|jgi:phosphatidylglycerol lysyltransferase